MPEPGESPEERVNRELIELLNELRVALPGVQVLFAFLLAVPFSQRFAEVTDLQKDAYMVALLCTMAGSVFLIAPAAHHRIRFRDPRQGVAAQALERVRDRRHGASSRSR